MATKPPSGVDKMLALDGIEVVSEKEDTTPLYAVLGDSKIPVSKKMGVLWRSRKDQGLAARGQAQARWDEAIRYYENDQTANRKSVDNSSGNTAMAQRLNSQYTETENVVFANTSIMVPMLYSKNPSLSVTSDNTQLEALGAAVQSLSNKLMSMRTAPGLSMKTKMRRSILTALLTNAAIVKVNWVQKQDSSEQAITELQELTAALEVAKTPKAIKEVEGKIMALEEKVNMLSPSGPAIRCLTPHHLVIDPTAESPDGSDANWMMEWDYLPTDYINAVYATKRGDQYISRYEPTHIMMGKDCSSDGVQEEVDNFKLIPDTADAQPAAYGYMTEGQLKSASMTKVWYVWDKTTRRVFLFADNYWKWPIWVWDDPLKLPRFFPYFVLWFQESVSMQSPKGEVTYYLDQQDAINEINDETRRGRYWAKRNIFYDKNALSQEDAEAVLKGPDGTARGVKLPEGVKLNDAIMSITPPALKFPELFSTESKFAAINRITGINDAMRGAQFKTNTTNKAVEAYNANSDIRVEERVDLIEDFISDIMWNVSMLCLMNWELADVTPLIGAEAEGWQKVTDNRMFDTMLNLRVETGSIGKPNSKEMKQQAVALGQVLGQFAQAAPATVVVMMKMFEKAFEGQVVISKEDWDMLIQTIMMSLTKAGSGPGSEGAPPEGQQDAGAAQSDEQLKQQVAQQIAALPAAAKAELEKRVAAGEPPAQALQEVQKQVQQAQP